MFHVLIGLIITIILCCLGIVWLGSLCDNGSSFIGDE